MATLQLLLLLLPYVLSSSLPIEHELIVTTKSGKVQGKLLPTPDGEVRAFLGIPFAKPPVGNLRFRHPQAADPWQGVRDATNYGDTCMQLRDVQFPGFRGAEMWNPNTPLSEDCLYLNVWTPTESHQSPLPVMIWIYGGGFTSGSSSLDLYDGRYLTKSEDVIVVSMNYRLSIFGFLSLPNNPNIPGNAALMDQRLAIQWVVDNIAAFGGDPSQITLFGESAGSASVGFQVISPGSNVLFQRAVMESGAPTSPWATLGLDETWERAITLSTKLGCPTSDPAELETCLQKVQASALLTTQFEVMTSITIGSFPFLPVVDGIFLPDTPDALLEKNIHNKEVLLGLNENEGSYFLIYSVPGFDFGNSLINKKQLFYGLDLLFGDSMRPHYKDILHTYRDTTVFRDLLEIVTADVLFKCPVQSFGARYHQAGGKPFLYHFQHRSSYNPWPKWMGVMHGYEIEFVFGQPLISSLGYTPEEVNMSKRIMKYWSTFARTGNPGGDAQPWPVFTAQNKAYVTVDTHSPINKTNLQAAQCMFWDQLV